MQHVLIAVGRFVRNCDGQDLLEYGLLVALISLFAYGAVNLLGQTINNVFWTQIAQLAQNL
jgi:Flp pilus assembly pilin Flp